jgi:ketosteroid isomerase-like protein
MVRRYIAVLVFGAVSAALTLGQPVGAWQADDIIALERGALDRWGQSDPGGYLELYARDVTYFDPTRERRVDGLAAMTQLLEPIRGKVKSDGYEMIAPKVHRAGTMAVLTYNLVSRGRGPDGKPMAVRWNSTAVYAQVEGRWKIVHSHWSFTKPEVKMP